MGCSEGELGLDVLSNGILGQDYTTHATMVSNTSIESRDIIPPCPLPKGQTYVSELMRPRHRTDVNLHNDRLILFDMN